jgi:uncharacterized membrane protein
MNLLKKLTLSLCLVTLIMPSYSYSYYFDYFYETDYSFDKDLSETVVLLKNRLMLPYDLIKNLQHAPQNLYGITQFVTNPLVLLMVGGYYYYQLNQNSKAQQLMIEKLKAELEKQKQTENQLSGSQTEEKSYDSQDIL